MANKPSIPKGTRDFLPEQSLKRQYIFDTARSVFQLYGYQPIETPAMENLDTLLGKYGEEGDKLLFRITDSADKPERSFEAKLLAERSNTPLREFAEFGKAIEKVVYQHAQSKSDLESLRNALVAVDSPLSDFEKTAVVNEFVTELSEKGMSVTYWTSDTVEKSVEPFKVSRWDYITGTWSDTDNMAKDYLKKLNEIFFTTSVSYISALEKAKRGLGNLVSEKALRYDLTVPFARFVVQNQNELSFPFKRYQIQPVWRADRPQKGRYREFYQCDVDVIGSDSLLNEAELLSIVNDVFTRLGLADIVIRLNNRKVLSGIADAAGLKGYFTDMCMAIDKLDKIGVEGVREEMLKRGLPEPGVKKVLNLIGLKGKAEDTLRMLANALVGVQEAHRGIEEIKQVIKALPDEVKSKVQIDLTLARGLNYYTGAIIEVGHAAFPSSICGGGRYDDLTGIFGLKGMSGVGVSFGADRIFDLMEQLQLFPESLRASSDVFFVNFGDAEARACLKLATALRSEGFSAEVYPDSAKMQKQMKYADGKGVRYAVFIGSEELKLNQAKVKDMRGGEEYAVLQQDLAKFIQEKTGNR